MPTFNWPAPWNNIATCTKMDGSPLIDNLVVSDPCVYFDYNTLKFHMWFTACDSKNNVGFGYATSTNGYQWEVWKKASKSDPLIDLVLKPGAWDSVGIETANMCKGPDNIWRMYYTGNRSSPQNHYAIGLATSTNGVSWTRRSSPVLVPTLNWEKHSNILENQGVLEPSVLWDDKIQHYRMWYAALGVKNEKHTYRMGHAISKNGISWTKTLEPVFEPRLDSEWDGLWVSHMEVIKDPTQGFHLFYHGSTASDYREGTPIQIGKFGHAYSLDGINWERSPHNPILSPQEWSLVGPSVIPMDNGLLMWYAEFEKEGSLLSKIKLAQFTPN